MKVLRRLALIIILVLLAGAGATPALAGEYPVYACDPAHGNVNGAWAGFTGGGGTLVEENCPTPRGPNPWQQGLVARHIPGVTSPRNAIARVTFTAPPGASLSRMSYDHRFCGGATFNAGIINAAGTWLHYSGPLSCGTLVLSPNTLNLGGTPWVSLAAICVRDTCPGNVESTEYAAMRSVTVWVSDSTVPQLTVTGGSATTPGWKRGSVSLGYQATDNTGIAYIDIASGEVVLDRHVGQCDQTHAAPCPNWSGPFVFDTRNLPDGTQTLLIRTEDAANNWATTTVPINVDNTAPSAPLDLTVAGGSGWRQTNSFSFSWRNPSQAGNAPIANAMYAVCPAQTPPSDWTGCRPSGRHLTSRHLMALRYPVRGHGPFECGCVMRPVTRAETRPKPSRSGSTTHRRASRSAQQTSTTRRASTSRSLTRCRQSLAGRSKFGAKATRDGSRSPPR